MTTLTQAVKTKINAAARRLSQGINSGTAKTTYGDFASELAHRLNNSGLNVADGTAINEYFADVCAKHKATN